MKQPNRDLLLLFNQSLMTPQAIEDEVERLHGLLYGVERMDNLVGAHELIDLNRYKIIQNRLTLRSTLRSKSLKAFVFLNCRN